MATFNAAIGWVFERLLSPLDALPPLVALAILALPTAAIMLLVVRAVSNQARIIEVKRLMQASLFECRLFQDDLVAVFRALGELLWRNGQYLRLSFAPILWAAVPLAIVTTQLDLQFGYAAPVGAPLILTARVADGVPADTAAAASLDAPDGVEVLTPAVWIPGQREVLWRVAPRQSGEFRLTVRMGGASFEKSLSASEGSGRRSLRRPGAGLVDQVLYPAERPLLPNSAITDLRLDYAPRDIVVAGWPMPWLVPYFALALAWGLVLKGPMRVTI